MGKKTVAEIIIETFVQAGARRCYGVPGDTLNFFTDAIRRNKHLRWIHVRHEEVGGFAAGADALLTGELALCAGSCGPGSLHFINGLCESNRNRAPVILIASQLQRDDIGFDFPQEIDFKAVYSSVSVFCEEVRSSGQAQRLAAMAAQAALNKRGVAVLIVPVDVSKESIAEEPGFVPHRAAMLARPDNATLAQIAALLNAGKKVTIFGGVGCEDAHDETVALAAKLKAPIVHSSRAKDFLDYDNPYNVGMTGILGNAGGMNAVFDCDTLLLLGCDFAWRQYYPSHAKVVQIDIDPSHLGRRYPVDVAGAGDVKTTLEALLPRVDEKKDRAFLDHALEQARTGIAKYDERAVVGKHGAIHPQYVARLISQHADRDAIFCGDGGSPFLWTTRHIETTGKNRTIVTLRHGTMANAMPQSLGAKAAYPDRQVIALCGDGGFTMLMGDILTTVQEALPVKLVIFNNGKLGMVDLEQKAEGLLDTYIDLKNPDFSKLAEVVGIWGRRVTDPALLEDAVKAWLATPGPAILDVTTNPNELVMPPDVHLGEVAGMAMYTAKALLSGRESDALKLIESAATTIL